MTIKQIKHFLETEIEKCNKALDDLFKLEGYDFTDLIAKEMNFKTAYQQTLDFIEGNKNEKF